MPPKKKTASQVDQGAVAAQGNVFSEGADPMGLAIGVIDKKARNLEKRKVWLSVPSADCFVFTYQFAVHYGV